MGGLVAGRPGASHVCRLGLTTLVVNSYGGTEKTGSFGPGLALNVASVIQNRARFTSQKSVKLLL
jgi:hypothetical protein